MLSLRLDVRDTCMGDSEIPMFSRLPSIKVLKMGHTTDKPFVPPQDSEGSGIITDRGVQSMCPSNSTTNTFYTNAIYHCLECYYALLSIYNLFVSYKQMVCNSNSDSGPIPLHCLKILHNWPSLVTWSES